MNRDHIRSVLEKAGYDAQLTADTSELTLSFAVGGQRLTLVHAFPSDLLRTPKFRLTGGYNGKLAHVGVDRNRALGEVCVGDPESTAVNIYRPERVYLDAVERHVDLLTRLIEDPEYNRTEQLGEFAAHWDILCCNAEGGLHEIFVAWDGEEVQELRVKRPCGTSDSDLRSAHIAVANDQRPASVRGPAGWESRRFVGKALGVPLTDVEPAPATQEDLLPWYFRALGQMRSAGRHEYQQLHKRYSRDYWLIFAAPIPGGETMFAIHWFSQSACPLPSSGAQARRWTVTPYRVRSLSRKALVPRGGGSLDLSGKSVLLIGCGSVGSELALRLTSAGVGRLTISDPEKILGGKPLSSCPVVEGHRPAQG